MHRGLFESLHELIKDHRAFRWRIGCHCNLLKQQNPVCLQLLVFLSSLGASGSDSNNKSIATRFHVSQGVVHLFVQRVTKAMLSHTDKTICWPSEEEMLTISTEVLQQYGLPNCIGYNGWNTVLASVCPFATSWDYHSREGFYAVQALIICNHNYRINHIYIGWPGVTHDNRVWRNSKYSATKSCFSMMSNI